MLPLTPACVGTVVSFEYEGEQRKVAVEEFKMSKKTGMYYIVGKDEMRDGAYRSFHIEKICGAIHTWS